MPPIGKQVLVCRLIVRPRADESEREWLRSGVRDDPVDGMLGGVISTGRAGAQAGEGQHGSRTDQYRPTDGEERGGRTPRDASASQEIGAEAERQEWERKAREQ